jgi:hypothetical protein
MIAGSSSSCRVGATDNRQCAGIASRETPNLRVRWRAGDPQRHGAWSTTLRGEPPQLRQCAFALRGTPEPLAAVGAPMQAIEQCRAECSFEPTSVPDQKVVVGEVGVRLRSYDRCSSTSESAYSMWAMGSSALSALARDPLRGRNSS